MLSEHLEHPRGRGHEPAGAHHGAAGGAVCGDLIRVSVAVEGDRVADAGFDASGCGTMIAAGSAVVELVRGAPCSTPPASGPRAISAELGGLSPGKLHAADLAADALHRALGAAARADAAVPAAEGRTLVAMSGGVDSAVAALLCSLEAPGDVAAVTLELWRDPENDGEQSCCSASAVRGARALAHRMGLPHFTLDLRDEFRAGVVEPFLADHAAGLTPNPCVRCNGHVRLDAMIEFADRLGAAQARHRPLRAPHRGRAAAPRRRPGQGPELHARRARPGLDRPAALPSRRSDEAAGARDRRPTTAFRWPASPTRRTSASWPAPGAPRS